MGYKKQFSQPCIDLDQMTQRVAVSTMAQRVAAERPRAVDLDRLVIGRLASHAHHAAMRTDFAFRRDTFRGDAIDPLLAGLLGN